MLGFDPLTMTLGAGLLLASFDDCPRPAAATVEVTTDIQAPSTDFSPSLDDLRRFDVDTQLIRDVVNPHIAGITRSGINVNYIVDFDGRIFGDQACVWISTVEIVVRSRPEVLIAREYPPGTCEHDAVMEHEMKHVRVDHNLAARYAERFRRAAQDAVGGLGVRYVSDIGDMQRVQKTLENRIGAAIDAVSAEYQRDRNRFQNAVDRPSEYRRVHALCDGWKRRN